MMQINTIHTGIVIDHIKAGKGLKLFNYLGLNKADCVVALIMNVPSRKMGKKDIIKIENNINIDLAELGLIDPDVTIDIIENEQITKKLKLKLPEKVEDVIKCKNPRCVTSVEKYIPHIFYLVNEEKAEYRCTYCDEKYSLKEI